jgi:Holliday junction resolvasome RuvABC endonuclease subunit
MPEGGVDYFTILGIDPGSNTLGVAVLRIDIKTLKILSSDAMTLKGAKEGRRSWATAIHGDRVGRIDSHKTNLGRIFDNEDPLFVASESPFMAKRMPTAYGALTEVVCAIRDAMMEWDMWRPLHLIDPPTVKNAVGVPGNKGGPEGKLLMQKAVLKFPPFVESYKGSTPAGSLDEHSVDAWAVAYAFYLQMREKLCLTSN